MIGRQLHKWIIWSTSVSNTLNPQSRSGRTLLHTGNKNMFGSSFIRLGSFSTLNIVGYVRRVLETKPWHLQHKTSILKLYLLVLECSTACQPSCCQVWWYQIGCIYKLCRTGSENNIETLESFQEQAITNQLFKWVVPPCHCSMDCGKEWWCFHTIQWFAIRLHDPSALRPRAENECFKAGTVHLFATWPRGKRCARWCVEFAQQKDIYFWMFSWCLTWWWINICMPLISNILEKNDYTSII